MQDRDALFVWSIDRVGLLAAFAPCWIPRERNLNDCTHGRLDFSTGRGSERRHPVCRFQLVATARGKETLLFLDTRASVSDNSTIGSLGPHLKRRN